MRVEPRPPFFGVERLEKRKISIRVSRCNREGWCDEGGANHTFRMIGSEDQRPLRPERERDEQSLLGRRCVHDGESIGRERFLRVRLRIARTVGLAVPAWIERDDAVVPRKIGDLELPAARMEQRPRRQEQDGRLPVPVCLVEDSDAVALDVALLVGVAGPRLLACDFYGFRRRHSFSLCSSQPSIQSSSSAWPFSMPESRSRIIPSLNVITSET